jgi:hypothetical protein
MTWLATAGRHKAGGATVRLDCRKSNLMERPSTRVVDIRRQGPRTNITCRVEDLPLAKKRGEAGLVKEPTLRELIAILESDFGRQLSSDEVRFYLCESGPVSERHKPNSVQRTLKRMGRLDENAA